MYKAQFADWENFLYIDPNIVATGVEWILHHQTGEGSFYEDNDLLHPINREMTGVSTPCVISPRDLVGFIFMY